MFCVLGNLAHPGSSSASRRRCGGLELGRVANCGNEVIEALSPSIVANLGGNEAELRGRSQYKTSGERDLHSMVVVAVGGQRQLRQIWKGSGSFHVGSFLSLRTVRTPAERALAHRPSAQVRRALSRNASLTCPPVSSPCPRNRAGAQSLTPGLYLVLTEAEFGKQRRQCAGHYHIQRD